jgi:aspartyl/glutamyl-tRNA(Asn/Gln) amidotransferase C subunit
VTDEEVPHLQDELNAILAFVDDLTKVDVTDIEPMTAAFPIRSSPMRPSARIIFSWCPKSWSETSLQLPPSLI